ncbi:MAG: SBBP repeat-containing protein, partial [Vicingaceae bacterium]
MNIHLKIIVLILSFISTKAISQNSNLEWAINIGGTNNDRGGYSTTDSLGNIYVTGNFNDTVDFDPGINSFNLNSVGNSDIFVLKLDNSGGFIWAKSFGGINPDGGSSIAVDNSGNIYVTGSFSGTVDFDPGINTFNLNSVGNDDIFVLKLDNTGDFIWAKSMGGTNYEGGASLTTNISGDIFITGEFIGTVDFDPGVSVYNLTAPGISNYPDIFILKLNSLGNFQWAKNIGWLNSDIGYSITTDVIGNIFLTGNFSGTVDFDPGVQTFNLTSNGSNAEWDFFILKLNSNGDFIWATSTGGTEADFSNSITIDPIGNIYVTGVFQDVADFDPGSGIFNLVSYGYNDIFIQKLDATGNFIWAKGIGGSSYDGGYSITTDETGNVYVVGNFYDTVDFNQGGGNNTLVSVGSPDVFVLKLNTNGNFLWVRSIEGTGYAFVRCINSDTFGNIHVIGSFIGTEDFDPEGSG